MRLSLLLLLFFVCATLRAQKTERPPFALDSTVVVAYKDGKQLVDSAEYEAANLAFTNLLATGHVMPDGLTFHFGKSLYHTEHPVPARKFLRAYLLLTDSSGPDSPEAIRLLDSLDTKYHDLFHPPGQPEEEVHTEHDPLDEPCNGKPKVLCPVCGGDGVVIRRGAVGEIYQTCPYGNPDGTMDCNDYKLFLKGELKPKR